MNPNESSFDEAHLLDLVKAVQAGQSDRYEELWSILAPYAYILMLVRHKRTGAVDREATERLTNEIGSRLWEHFKDFDPVGPAGFLTWFYEFCRRLKKQLLREKKKLVTGILDKIQEVEDYDPAEDFFGDNQPKPLAKYQTPSRGKQWALKQKDSILNKLIREEDRQRLAKIKESLKAALQELDPVEQYVIYGRFFTKLPYETISQRLEGNTGKSKYYAGLCFWALQKLKRLLAEKYGIKQLPEQEDTK